MIFNLIFEYIVDECPPAKKKYLPCKTQHLKNIYFDFKNRMTNDYL